MPTNPTELALADRKPDAASLALLPVDELGIWLLQRLAQRQYGTFQRGITLDGLLREVGLRTPTENAYRPPRQSRAPHLGQALAEAWDWLRSEALIAEAATGALGGHLPVDGFFFVTRLGHRVGEASAPLSWIAAQRRLGVELHPRLEERARRQFVLGEFAAAAFVAMREVEIAVREAAGLGAEDVGAKLMNSAFKPDEGPLADAGDPRAEQEGLQSLFRGAIQVFKNPASHRRVDFDDPTEAAEVVLFADLLLRILEHRAQRQLSPG